MLLRDAPPLAGRRRGRHHRRQRRDRPGPGARRAARTAPRSPTGCSATGCAPRRLRAAAADAPVSAPARAAASASWAATRAATTQALARWAATRSDVSHRGDRGRARRRRRWRATAFIPASRFTAPAVKRLRRTPPRWNCGDIAASLAGRRTVTVTKIAESAARRRRSSPAFRRRSCSPTSARKRVQSQAWLRGRTSRTADGRLIASIHAFVVESRGQRPSSSTPASATTRCGPRPPWTRLQRPLPRRLRAPPASRSTASTPCCAPIMHSDHVGWNTRARADGRWVPTFPRARYLLSRLDYDGLADADDDNSREVLADSIAPCSMPASVDWVDELARDHRRGPPRADSRATRSGTRQRSHPLERAPRRSSPAT